MTAKPLQASQSLYVSAPDGLQLHVHAFGCPSLPPVVCLPGLARSTADFVALAEALATDTEHPRHVLAIDSRGRGRSEYDRNAANYTLAVELDDLLAVLTALNVEPAVFVGTSRGGILTMLLTTVRPCAITGAVLNDIGPVIETKGLVRIKNYVGKLPQPRTIDEATQILRQVFGSQFTGLTADQWKAFADRTFREENGVLSTRYDPALVNVLKDVDLEHPLPTLWKEFEALASVPLMVIRGVNSDLLSEQTLAAMRLRRPDLEELWVTGQGHAPLLEERAVTARIGAFVARCQPKNTPADMPPG
jgi:pimeloyl-ACP methyl ester carboxylesterase